MNNSINIKNAPKPIRCPDCATPNSFTNDGENWRCQVCGRTERKISANGKSKKRGLAFAAICLIAVLFFIIDPFSMISSFSSARQSSGQNPSRRPVSEEPVEIFTNKYIHTDGLNVRAGPSLDSEIKFSLTQNTIVRVSDSDKSGAWVKINYRNNEGYVNQTYLRDFIITEIKVGDQLDGDFIVQPGSILNGGSLHYLGIQVKIDTVNSYNAETNFKIKIIDPYGNLFYSRNSTPPGYTYEDSSRINKSGYYSLGGWGTNSGGSYYRGSWRVEIWYESPANPSNTNTCIAAQNFWFE